MINEMIVGKIADAELVSQSLQGERDAFEEIVSRYQSLICSLAYSATGSLGQSQDLAQETFITAWKHLRLLRERDKLRSWLCGIARRLIGKAARRDGREPISDAEPLDISHESAAIEPSPAEKAISQEEEAILWRSIERIPPIYREPLVLFYREHQSVEKVATALDLSEDAVKQRLSRGRRLLHDEVLVLIETTLERSSPGKAFTIGVLAALPVFASSSSAATLGVTIAKGGTASKAGSWLVLIKLLAGPLTGFLATYLGYKISMQRATSDGERRFIKQFFGSMAVFVVAPLLLVIFAVSARPLAASHPSWFVIMVIGVASSWIPAIASLCFWVQRKRRILNATGAGPVATHAIPNGLSIFEYRTKTCLLGLPLIHVRLGGTWASRSEAIKAWIAVADHTAIGMIFAFGGVAIAPIAIGGFALGGLVFGGFGAGALCYAGFAVGVCVVGGVASGLMAVGGFAFGWKAALGGIAIAREFAQGGIAFAAHANDSATAAFTKSSPFFRIAFALVTKWLWPTLALSVLPSLIIAWATRKRLRR
jgi:RNA polymerase sigma factor (sigma-70 family)